MQRQVDREEARAARLLDDQRFLREAKRNRLHQSLTDLLVASDAIVKASHQMEILWLGDTPASRDARIQAELTTRLDQVEGAWARLSLEAGGDELLSKYNALFDLFLRYSGKLTLHMNAPTEQKRETMGELTELRADLPTALQEFRAASRSMFTELNEPI